MIPWDRYHVLGDSRFMLSYSETFAESIRTISDLVIFLFGAIVQNYFVQVHVSIAERINL